ncbi:interleukin-1 family member 10-like isoform X1 [Pezoporus occidentalis]|uniref:interleukin-1 family member 10-like isoform X1 n=1 Tax=Pezoporus occidentalis TaxID=407982 RepID=UPI002F9120D8
MRDVDHKSLYLRDGRLVAGHLQGANAAREEEVFWVPNRAFAPARLPLVMGIQNGSRCLASAPGPRPSLSLQDADIRELPRAGAASAAFTFFRSYRAGLWRFESAANPGWFLCTSARGHQPLGLSRCPDASTRLDFYFSAAECPEPGAGDRDPPIGHRDLPPADPR